MNNSKIIELIKRNLKTWIVEMSLFFTGFTEA